jgi:hypothetical protein
VACDWATFFNGYKYGDLGLSFMSPTRMRMYCSLQIRLHIREGAPFEDVSKQLSNRRKILNLVMYPESCPTPRRNGRSRRMFDIYGI